VSYYVADSRGYIADLASGGGIAEFYDWALDHPGPIADLALTGSTSDPASLADALDEEAASGAVEDTRAALADYARKATDILIISDGTQPDSDDFRTSAEFAALARRPSYTHIHRAADKYAPPIQSLIVKAGAAMRSRLQPAEIEAALRVRDYGRAVAAADSAIDEPLREQAQLAELFLDIVAISARSASIPGARVVGAPGAIKAAAARIGRYASGLSRIRHAAKSGKKKFKNPPPAPMVRGPFTLSFDRVNPHSVDWARSKSAELITEVRDSAKASVRRIITRALDEGLPPRQSSKLIQKVVGLTEAQSDAVANLEDRIRDNPGGKIWAGSRPVRVPAGGASESWIDKVTSAYSDRLHRQRALTIARTETMRASNEGQQEMWAQAIESGLLTGDEFKMWILTPDDRLCDECAAMEGEVVGIMEDFSTGENPPLHPNCRCTIELTMSRPEPAAEGEAEAEAEETANEDTDLAVAEARALAAIAVAEGWDESQHPRDDSGKFAGSALSGGYKLTETKGDLGPSFEFVGPQGGVVGRADLIRHPDIGMTVHSISVFTDVEHSARGLGLARQAIDVLVRKYGRLSSSPDGRTSSDADKMWQAVGADKVPTDINARGFYWSKSAGPRAAEWDESDHPRDAHGEFTDSKGGSVSHETVAKRTIKDLALDELNMKGACGAATVYAWDRMGRPKDLVPYNVTHPDYPDEGHVLLYNKKTGEIVDPAGRQFDRHMALTRTRDDAPYVDYRKVKASDIPIAREAADEMFWQLHKRYPDEPEPRAADYNPDQPRDESGRWTSEPGGSKAEISQLRQVMLDDANYEHEYAGRGPVTDLRNVSDDARSAIKSNTVVDIGRDLNRAGADELELNLSNPINNGPQIVQDNLDCWAATSGDSNPDAIQKQMAVKEEFKLDDAAVEHMEIDTGDPMAYGDEPAPFAEDLTAGGPQKPKDVSGYFDPDYYKTRMTADRMYARAEYEHTQAWLKDRGITHVTVFRGEEISGEIETGDITVRMQPASSWTTDLSTALGFADPFREMPGGTANGRILAVRVPASRILSTCITGRGCVTESEVVLLGGLMKVRAVPSWGSEALEGSLRDSAERVSDPDIYEIDAELSRADWPKRTDDRRATLGMSEIRFAAEWDESDHPRGPDGKFTGSGGESGASDAASKRPHIGLIAPDGTDHISDGEDHTDIARKVLNIEEGGVPEALSAGYVRYWVRRGGEVDINFQAGHPEAASHAMQLLRDYHVPGTRIYIDIEAKKGLSPGRAMVLDFPHFFDNIREANAAIREAGSLSAEQQKRRLRAAAEWDEADHPRDPAGKFTDKGGGAADAKPGAVKGEVPKIRRIDKPVEGGPRRSDVKGARYNAAWQASPVASLTEQQVADRMLVDVGDRPWDVRFFVSKSDPNGPENAITMHAKNDVVTVMRTFTPDGIVDHVLMDIDKDVQDAGISRGLLAKQMELYRDMGIREVHMLANLDVGGYAWARAGFLPADPAQAADKVAQRVAELVTDGVIDDREGEFLFSKAFEIETKPDTIWELADLRNLREAPPKFREEGKGSTQTLGKLLLLDVSWKARATVADAMNPSTPQGARFAAYFSKRKRGH
jgi:SPP1 gp7 family putative phage head morphogenesis protein